MFIAAVVTIAKTWKQSKCPSLKILQISAGKGVENRESSSYNAGGNVS